MFHNKFLLIFFLSTLFLTTSSRTAQEWKSRIIYEIVTDRFARTDGDTTPCSNFNDYCGGTFKGIQNNLDYIQGMGFNAIWISPVQANIPGGYHGYWYSNFYKLNENFGSEQDLRDLINACHERDIWVIVDIVANHVGYVQRENISDSVLNDYSSSVPFNDPSHYNSLVDSCADAEKKYPGNQAVIETCWLAYLPDLDQNNPFVRTTLIEWIAWFVKDYNIDGIRLDAIRHVSPNFWAEFTKASGVFSIGESFLFGIAENAAYLKGAMDSMLNFPFNSVIYHTFIKRQSMKQISDYYDEAYKIWPDIAVLGNFVGNHDIARYLSYDSTDKAGLKAALAFLVFTVGIPTVYYGDEQAFDGGDDPQNREPLWTNMNAESDGYQFLRTINLFRRKVKLHELDQVQRAYDDEFYSFTRGEYFFAFTNSQSLQRREVSEHSYADDVKLCNLFDQNECVEVKNGKFAVTLVNKEVKVLIPSPAEDSDSLNAYKILQQVKVALATSLCNGVNSLAT